MSRLEWFVLAGGVLTVVALEETIRLLRRILSTLQAIYNRLPPR